MAFDSNSAFTNTDGSSFPDNKAVNASGPTTQDGTEYVKAMIDNYMFGRQQALLNFAGLTPNGVAEEDGNSQELEALQKSFGYPGESVNWYGENDPATEGARILLLHGQGVDVNNYPDLVSAVYVGDTDNPTADAFYRADNSDGTSRNTAGQYLILPDMRGFYPRFIGEDNYSVNIANNGSVTIGTRGPDNQWWDSIIRSATGQIDIDYTGLGFSDNPNVLAIGENSSENVSVTNITPTSCRINSRNIDNLNFIDQDIYVRIRKHSSDYNSFPENFIEPGIRY